MEFMGIKVKVLEKEVEIWAAKAFTENIGERNRFAEIGETAVFVEADADFDAEFIVTNSSFLAKDKVTLDDFVDVFSVARGNIKIGGEERNIITVTLLAKRVELDEARRVFGEVRV